MISHGGSLRVRPVKMPSDDRAPILQEYVRIASSGRKHFPLPVGASLAEFAAIASQYPVYESRSLADDIPVDSHLAALTAASKTSRSRPY